MKLIPTVLGLALFAAAPLAMAQNCTINVKGDDAMKFDIKEATVSASCKAITINLEHTGKLPKTAMGHNVVLSRTQDMAGINRDAIKAGAANGYLPSNDARVLAATDMIGGGEKSSVTLPGSALTVGEDYSFFCSFPGHATLMKGKVNVVE